MRIGTSRLMAVLIVVAMWLPSAAAAQDLRSPDARDATPSVAAAQDLRSPDARDATATAVTAQDLRSPDARDAADGVQVVPVVITTPAADEFDWGDAAIGAGIALAGIALVGAGIWYMRRRRVVPPTAVGRIEPAVQHHGRVRTGSRTRRRAGMR